MGLKSSKIEQVLGHKDYDEVIHRDNMAVEK
jgi:glutamate 5-kinase